MFGIAIKYIFILQKSLPRCLKLRKAFDFIIGTLFVEDHCEQCHSYIQTVLGLAEVGGSWVVVHCR